MAEYLQRIVTAEVSAKNKISSRSINFNELQCEFLVSKLHAAVEQAKKFLTRISSSSSEEYTEPLNLFRHFYREVKAAVTLLETFCRESWVRVAVVNARARESFTLACLELDWFTAIFTNLTNLTVSEGISELAGEARMITETAKQVATLARRDEDALRLKLQELLLNYGPSTSEHAHHARMLLQKLQHEKPHPKCWTLDATELVMGKLIGRGSSGIVYTTSWMNETHAMKVFFKSYRETFEQEVAILAGLNHPNVVLMIGSSVDVGGNSVLVEELMDEGLDTFVARKTQSGMHPLPLDEALDLMLQTAEGVQYLHQQGVVHRDLKPSNVLVKTGDENLCSSFVRVKVADFGISKANLEKSSTLSPLTKNVGTSRWMAPEILRGVSDSSDGEYPRVETLSYPFKVDIYSYALIAYEILTGRQPYSDMWPNEIKRRVKEENMRPELPASCPLGLAILFKRCWDADPRTRPSFSDVCNDLRHMKGHLLLEHPSVTLKAVSEVLNPDVVRDYHHILSMDAGRTYNKFTMLKNNKIVDLISHRELTSKEIYKRAGWGRGPVSAWNCVGPRWKISDFWPPSTNLQPRHVGTSARATAVLSSLSGKIKEKMRRPHATGYDVNDAAGMPNTEEYQVKLQMFLSAANQRLVVEEETLGARPPVTQTQVEESLDNVHKFLEQIDDDVSNLVDELSALKRKIAKLAVPDCPEKGIGFHYFLHWISS